MRVMVISVCLAVAAVSLPSALRANLLRVEVTSSTPTIVRAIWRPRAGVVGASVADQQRALANPLSIPTSPDSLRRWQNPAARDTIVAQTPAQFVVDMSGTDVVIEVVAGGVVRVEAQFTPARGPVVTMSGRAVTVHADGLKPSLEVSR
jgi:hypothetical protein